MISTLQPATGPLFIYFIPLECGLAQAILKEFGQI